jgi:GT2 family glycosyltransferase
LLISVCIPSIRPQTLGDAIASIRRQKHREWELIIVGQGDEQAVRSAVVQAAGTPPDPRIRYVHASRMGLSIARNRGIEEAAGGVVAFMDDDCEASDDWLAEIASAFDRHPRAGVVAGSLLRPPAGPGLFKVCPEMRPMEAFYDPATDADVPAGMGAAGANLAMRREVVESVGPFDELLGAGAPFQAAEETDYLLRAEALGVCMYSSPAIVMHHTHGYRYGALAAYRLLRNYARGNGALAAKLSLAGDPRGRRMLRGEFHTAVVDPLARLRLHLLPRRLVRLGFYAMAYWTCKRRFRVTTTELPSAVLRPALSAS